MTGEGGGERGLQLRAKCGEASETSGVTSALLLGYLDQAGGPEVVAEVLRRAGMERFEGELRDENSWFSWETKIALFEATADVLQNPGLELNDGHALVRFSEIGGGQRRHRLDCDYTAALLALIPELFGLAAAHVSHIQCAAGAVAGGILVRERMSWRREQLRHLQREVHDSEEITGRLFESLQEMVSDLRLEDVVAKVTRNAQGAVGGREFVLLVREGEHLVCQSSSNLPLAATARAISEACRRDDLAFRIGGDELALLLPRLTEDEAVEVASRVCTAIAELDARIGACAGIVCPAPTDADREALLARADGLSEHERELVAWAALVHDLGKLAVPRIVLDKPARLTDAEWELLRRHPDDGADVLESVDALAALAPAVRSSHERWDGTGYPLGLRGEQIPLAARIVAACDAFEAMTANRPYCEARSWSGAIEELRACAGSHFDPTVIVALVAELERVGEPTSYASGPPIAQGGSGPAHHHD